MIITELGPLTYLANDSTIAARHLGEGERVSAQRGDDRSGLSRRAFLGGVVALAAAAEAASSARPAFADSALGVTVENVTIGTGMPLVGYNTGHYLPGSNTSAWLEYSRVNAARFFASLTEWTPDDAVDPGDGIEGIADFDARKADLRRDPEAGPYLKWDIFNDVFENHVYSSTNYYRLNYQVSELRRLGVSPILEAAELRWNSPWSVLWQEWQKHYAFTYHLAKEYDVERYNFINEPDHPSAAGDLVNQAVYVRGLQIASDAIRCAIADVNAAYGKSLQATVQAPVLTHVSSSSGNDHMDADHDSDHRDDVYGWGQITLNNIRTDYHGATVDYDIFNVFDTHQYNKTATTYAYEFGMMRQKMQQYTPTGVALPIVYSEFNRRNTSAFETSGDDLNSPQMYCDLADIWATALANDAAGMIAFKFENTVRANGIPYGTGFYYVENQGSYDVHGVSKAGEMNRLFAKGFRGDRPRLRATADDGRTVVATRDAPARCYYLWLPRPYGAPAGQVSLNLATLPLSVGIDSGATAGPVEPAQVIVEEVSPVQSGGIVAVAPVPDDHRVTLDQPANSVWLVTVALPSPVSTVSASAAVTVAPNEYTDAELAVSLDTSGTQPSQVSYLAFPLPPGAARSAMRTRLEVQGSTTDGAPLTFHVYALTDTSWATTPFTWQTAPYLDGSAVRPIGVGATVFPAGQLTALGAPAAARLDVTDAVRHATQNAVGFMLIREPQRDGDTADNGRRAVFASRRASHPLTPRLVISR